MRVSVLLAAALVSVALLGSVALADGSLKRGSDNDEAAVKELQRLLQKAGCYDYGEITGYFGAATEEGVRKFQSTHGLTVDGVAGDETLQKLRGDVGGGSTQNPSSVSFGMDGQDVKDIQARLKKLGLFTEPEITGYFGKKTQTAVVAFQEAAGLKADGIVGADTRKLLFSDYRSDSLIPGMKGSEVEKLQNRLKALGYYTGPVTGLYGQPTEKSVAYFQKLNGLNDDGVAGKKTRAALFAQDARPEKDARRNPVPVYKNLPGQTANGQKQSAGVITYAKKFLGCPYVSGAAGPRAFECSGLTYYVFQNSGVTLPRKAYGQGYTNYGIKITDRTKLMPGDLVFFNSDPHDNDLCDHVGIYIGSGQMIHSPAPGMKVMISYMLNARDFSWARRVFK